MTISVRLDEDMKDILQQYAKDNDLSMSQVVRAALRDYLEKIKANEQK